MDSFHRPSNKQGIKKCPSYQHYPMPVFGKSVDGNDIFSIECDNQSCPDQPSTGGCKTIVAALSAWNQGIVTNTLFQLQKCPVNQSSKSSGGIFHDHIARAENRIAERKTNIGINRTRNNKSVKCV